MRGTHDRGQFGVRRFARVTGIVLSAPIALAACDSASDHPAPQSSAVVAPPVSTSSTTSGPNPVEPTAGTAVTIEAPSPAPHGDLPQWHQVLVDDFTTANLGPDWRRYAGKTGGDPVGWWDPRHVTVSNGMLQLRTYSDPAACRTPCAAPHAVVSGGAKLLLPLHYGRVSVRVRKASAPGVVTTASLFPASDTWPPSIEFYRGTSGARELDAILHAGDGSTVSRSTTADPGEWHTGTVEWLPGSLVYSVDGKVVGKVTGSAVPDVPMTLTVQDQIWPCPADAAADCNDAALSTRSQTQIDWVSVYVPAESRGSS